jgi:succinate dehydrogenase/fumarate reductase flavoprotein subunit
VSAPDNWDQEADVVVIGAGNGGLSAGAAALEEGKSVILLEISNFVGGGSAYSGGILHARGLENWEEYKSHTEGLGDQILGKVHITTFREKYVPWLQSIGAPLVRGDTENGKGYLRDWYFGSGEPGLLRHKAYFDYLTDYITGNGGEIQFRTRGLALVVDDNGLVCGVLADRVDEGNARLFIKAGSVILATGGFQSNKGLMAQYLGPNGDSIRNMGTPYNTGSGMLMAQGVGALIGGHFSGFSGTLCGVVPGPATEDVPELYEEARAGDPESLPGIGSGRPYAPPWIGTSFPEDSTGILVNLEGKRFMDESSPIDSKGSRVVQELPRQKRAMALMIADQTIFESNASSAALIPILENQGVQVFKADTLDDLGEQMAIALGFYKGSFIQTMDAYNAGAVNGNNVNMEVSRVQNHLPIETAPFYAVAVTSSAYHTFGGLVINENSQVLDLGRIPIPNLYACPPTAAMFREVYAGGIGSAGTFGYIAGKHAAAKGN